MIRRLCHQYWRLALCYCYIFVLSSRECNSSWEGAKRERQGYRGQRQSEEWVVRLEGGPEVASLLALRSGYAHVGPVIGFEDTYLWRAIDGSSRHKKRGMSYAMRSNTTRAKIIWADEQRELKRHKRDLYYSEAHPELEVASISSSQEGDRDGGDKTSNVVRQPRAFNDELWDQEWYLLNQGEDATQGPSLKPDLNVLPVYWLGITGKGVRVAVLDDGIEHTHEDLRANYDPEISYDVTDRDDDPMPKYDDPVNRHGTRCAGEIAMEANNGKCGVGVAYEARIGGIKMLDGVVNDRVEAESLSFRSDLVDIYTASWGPPDDGMSLEAPGRLAFEALERGILQGRGGKGSIFVWASGNGGSKGDDCGCDGYVGSPYTVAISSASQSGSLPWYGEMCPATLATTYSSGALQEQMIATTDLHNNCTTSHTGTSASAPLAAGILALGLEANKNLTWRDVQHLIVHTSNPSSLRNNPGWFRNAVGLWFNVRFGFGMMDAHALVVAASNWTTVPVKGICLVSSYPLVDRELRYGAARRVQFESDGCPGSLNEIQHLEHVQLETSVEYTYRGALQMHLTAPSGTRVQMLGTRKLDNSSDGFVKWKFMSVATWGENPRGTWSLDILDEVGPEYNRGYIGASKLILHGTKERPHYLAKSLRDRDSIFGQGDKLDHNTDGETNAVRNLMGKQFDESLKSPSFETWLNSFLM